jgi:hypothetical protein
VWSPLNTVVVVVVVVVVAFFPLEILVFEERPRTIRNPKENFAEDSARITIGTAYKGLASTCLNADTGHFVKTCVR